MKILIILNNIITTDKSVITINSALRKFNNINSNIYYFKQIINMSNPYLDGSYIGLINQKNNYIEITIPSECHIITNIKNNKNYEMELISGNCTYPINKISKELSITLPSMNFTGGIQITEPIITGAYIKNKNAKLIIYSKLDPELVISYNVFFIKIKSAL
jgi:hypothetical protein